jgi:hypothetical protein
MIVQDFATAKILFILASDDRTQLQELTRDLKRSKYLYSFSYHADKATAVDCVSRTIADNDGRLPIVLVVNHKFAGKTSKTLLELARDAAKGAAIECVVTHPPTLAKERQTLLALGARLFEEEADMALAELTLH